MMRLSSYNGNPYIGVYCVANEYVSFIPVDSPKTLSKDIEEALGVEVEKCTIGSTSLIGALLAMNSYGAVVTNTVSKEEVRRIAARLPVYTSEDPLNA